MSTSQPVLNSSISASRSLQSSLGKHLIFALGPEEFGIQVLNVKEIIGMQEITAVPKMPPHVKGVINLRGQVIPVIDLSLKFTLPSREYTERTCIIVVRTQTGAGDRLMGAIADGVTEVLTIAREDVEVSPDFGNGSPAPYLLGMAKVRGKVKLLLDINEVFNTDALIQLQPASFDETQDAVAKA